MSSNAERGHTVLNPGPPDCAYGTWADCRKRRRLARLRGGGLRRADPPHVASLGRCHGRRRSVRPSRANGLLTTMGGGRRKRRPLYLQHQANEPAPAGRPTAPEAMSLYVDRPPALFSDAEENQI